MTTWRTPPALRARNALESIDWRRYERVIVLSPHLDDAALSCGGLLLALREITVPRLVITVTAGNPLAAAELSGVGRGGRERRGYIPPAYRRREDGAAMRSIGCDYLHLGFPDAIYRRSSSTGRLLYPSPRSRWGVPHLEEQGYLAELSIVLRRVCWNLGRVLVLSPLGIGPHVDHQLCAAAAKQLQRRGTEVLFYEDFPYSAGLVSQLPTRDTPDLALARLGLRPAARFSCRFDTHAKLRLLAHYGSQVIALFGSEAALVRALGSHLDEHGEPVELTWVGRQLAGPPRSRAAAVRDIPNKP